MTRGQLTSLGETGSDMRPPIIVHARGDVSIYESVDEAQRDVEAVDVRNGEYEFYDSEGRVLRGVVVPRATWGLGKYLPPNEDVKLEPVSEPGAATEVLRSVLAGYLARVGAAPINPAASQSLDDLVATLLRFEKGLPL